MRDIKFRLWDTDKKQMNYLAENVDEGKFLSLSNHSWGLFDRDNYNYGGAICHKCFDDKLMQFTGLKDKNSEEIYEGDILKDTLLNCW